MAQRRSVTTPSAVRQLARPVLRSDHAVTDPGQANLAWRSTDSGRASRFGRNVEGPRTDDACSASRVERPAAETAAPTRRQAGAVRRAIWPGGRTIWHGSRTGPATLRPVRARVESGRTGARARALGARVHLAARWSNRDFRARAARESGVRVHPHRLTGQRGGGGSAPRAELATAQSRVCTFAPRARQRAPRLGRRASIAAAAVSRGQ